MHIIMSNKVFSINIFFLYLKKKIKFIGDRLENIEKKNQKILQRILSISIRNQKQNKNCSATGRLRSLGSFSNEKQEKKSLNYNFRKQEAEKITFENYHLAERLRGK